MKDRIQNILVRENLNAKRFADIIGIQSSAMSHILSGRNNASLDVVQKIIRSFPRINPDWLIMGIGDMYRNEVQIADKQNVDIKIETSKPSENLIFDGRIHFPPDDEAENELSTNESLSVNSPQNVSRSLNSEPEKKQENVKTSTEVSNSKPSVFAEEKFEPEEKVITETLSSNPSARSIKRIIVLYSDGTYEELYKS